jgi:hypothetical protein
MAKVERFEELVAWQKARKMTRQIYDVTKHAEFSKILGCAIRFAGPAFR